MQRYVDQYNNVRLNSATGYIAPKDMLAGRQREKRLERQSGTGLSEWKQLSRYNEALEQPTMTIHPDGVRIIGIAIISAYLALPACAAGPQAKASSAPWTGTITTTDNTTEPGFSFESNMNCDLKASSVLCTYKSTMKLSGTVSSVITESATQDHLQVSIFRQSGEWKLRVAAFMSTGTKTITANGQTRSANNVNIQAPNWEVPIPEPRDPNRSSGTWQNSSGGTIKWELSR